MLGRRVRASALFSLSCALLLSACSTWPDFQVLTAEGEANNAPIIIFGTNWTVPSQDEPSKIGFINLQYKDITSINVYTAQCRAKGTKHFAGHAVLTGPFKSRASFVADAIWADDASYLEIGGVSGIAVITKIEIYEADGGKLEYKDKDVKPLLDKNLRNYCSNFGA